MSSSSSSSYSSFVSSSASTGSFSSSSSGSISSCSTIVEAQPVARSFGCPDYNYFWIRNKSASNPKLSYYYNYKSHCVVWSRPVPENIPLPFYNTTWVPESPNLSGNDEDYIVSDPETKLRRKKRLNEKKRNERLAFEEQGNLLQVLSIKRNIKNRKMLETLWKLHRFPGETVEDVKKRLFFSEVEKVQVKVENLSDNENDTPQISTPIVIKQEPQDDYCLLEIDKVTNSIKKVEEDSDSDPEHVSYLIKQEYTMSCQETESENESENGKKTDEEIPEEIPEEVVVGNHFDCEEAEESSEEEYYSEEGTYHSNKRKMVNESKSCDITENEIKSDNSDDDNFDFSYEAPCLLSEYFEVEIVENNEENISIKSDDVLKDSLEKDNINWNFEKLPNVSENSNLTTLILNPFYSTPKLKKNTRKPLLSRKKKIQTSKKVNIKKEPVTDDEQKSANEDDGPIICNMYGTCTVNYNHPSKIKVPNWQSTARLSDSSEEDSGCEFERSKIKQDVFESQYPNVDKHEVQKSKIKKEVLDLEHQSINNDEINKLEQVGDLELKNWFPKKKNKKRKRSFRKSDSSWCESSLSDCTDIDDFDRTLIRMKKEKKFSSEEETGNHSETESDKVYIEPTCIKTEAELIACKSEANESKNEMSMTSDKPVVDLSIVKVERRSSSEEIQEHENIVVQSVKDKSTDGNSSSSSSSSSSSCCSRSSCSCSSSSMSSSEDEGNGDDKEAEKKGVVNM